jgi:hypothetical protein
LIWGGTLRLQAFKSISSASPVVPRWRSIALMNFQHMAISLTTEDGKRAVDAQRSS